MSIIAQKQGANLLFTGGIDFTLNMNDKEGKKGTPSIFFGPWLQYNPINRSDINIMYITFGFKYFSYSGSRQGGSKKTRQYELRLSRYLMQFKSFPIGPIWEISIHVSFSNDSQHKKFSTYHN